jgi:hypothetical protein
VRGDDHRHPHLVEGDQEFEHLPRRSRVEIGGRLVGNEQHRPIDHGAGNRQALLFAAGKRDGQGFFAFQEADLVERGARPALRLARVQADDFQRQKDVVERRTVEKEFLVLEHQADVAPQIRQGLAPQGGEVLAVDEEAAGRRPLDGAQKFQQGGLAGAGMAADEHHVAGGNFEVDVGQRLESSGVTLDELAADDHAQLTRTARPRTRGRRKAADRRCLRRRR